jgi:predicted metal-dependent hydrolase
MDATSTLAPARAAARRVPTRRVSFEESLRRLPKHFAKDGDLIASHVLASLSSVFPDGEDYFVRSVRYFRDQIDDPELARQVAGFIGQESVHGREHRVFNDRLDELGYPTKRMERLTRWGLAQRERIMSPKSNLAATAALEHFTATLAELVLTDEEARLIPGEPGVRDLFLWHALEESEHKAVAFDVYRAVGGSERMRIITMKLIRIGFIVGMTTEVLVSLAGDPATYERGRLRDSFRRFRRTPMLRREVWDQLRDYDRPDFHPDDRNTDELVEFWREALFGEDGSMVDKLSRAGSVA